MVPCDGIYGRREERHQQGVRDSLGMRKKWKKREKRKERNKIKKGNGGECVAGKKVVVMLVKKIKAQIWGQQQLFRI